MQKQRVEKSVAGELINPNPIVGNRNYKKANHDAIKAKQVENQIKKEMDSNPGP